MTNPQAAVKKKVLHTMAAITASENGASHDVRGVTRAQFGVAFTTLDNGTTDETYDVKIQTRHKSTDEWVDVPGLAFTQITGAISGGELLPTASNAPGVQFGRYVRVAVTLGGTTPIATGEVFMYYQRPERGPQVDHGAVS